RLYAADGWSVLRLEFLREARFHDLQFRIGSHHCSLAFSRHCLWRRRPGTTNAWFMIAIGGIGGGGLVGVVVELGKSLGLLSGLARDVGCRRPGGGQVGSGFRVR